jgi:hypothetical protein
MRPHGSSRIDAPRRYQIKSGVWLTEPLPFTPGQQFTATWRERHGRELQRFESPPLSSVDALEPVYGPGWTVYPVG